MLLTRLPQPVLRPFVQLVWASDDTATARRAPGARERVLPTGSSHVVIRLSDNPLRLFDDVAQRTPRTISHAIVGGVRVGFYVRDVSEPGRAVGAMLQPGAAELLLGVPADELADRHTPLEDVWGRAAVAARERLAEVDSPAREIDLFEALLAARLPRVRGIHPAVAMALARFTTSTDVGAVVEESGYSHRRFIGLFQHAVGLTPKLYCRVRRFHGVLERLATDPDASWADVALAAGYSDQPHLNRDFREFAGLSPGDYRGLSPVQSHHVPIPVGR
jgi:AraC-like DNA-binding protein